MAQNCPPVNDAGPFRFGLGGASTWLGTDILVEVLCAPGGGGVEGSRQSDLINYYQAEK
jgi:hypothetical protein